LGAPNEWVEETEEWRLLKGNRKPKRVVHFYRNFSEKADLEIFVDIIW